MIIIREKKIKKIKQNFIYFFAGYVFIVGMLPHKALYLKYFFILIAFFEALMTVTRRKVKYDWKILMPITPFIVVSILSSFFNKVSFDQYIELMPYYLINVLIFFYITVYRDYFGENELINLNKILIIGVFLQVPITIYQYLNWNPSKTKLITDAAYGTLGKGAANIMGYIMVMIIMLLIMLWKYTKEKKYLLLGLPMLITLVISESKIGYVLFVIFLVISVFSKFSISFAFIASGAAMIVYKIIESNMIFKNVLGQLNIDNIIQTQMALKGSMGRLYYLVTSINYIKKHDILFGYGPGNFLSYIGQKTNPELFYSAVPIDWVGSVDNQLPAILSEMGFLGLIAFLFILVFFFIKIIRFNIKEELLYIRAVRHWFLLYIIFFIIASSVCLPWQSPQFSVWFWLYAGLLYNICGHKR
ncbi:MAG: O-antigen ligase family protein [Clostridiales bacterium]